MERIKIETLRCQGKETYSGMRVHSLFWIQKKRGEIYAKFITTFVTWQKEKVSMLSRDRLYFQRVNILAPNRNTCRYLAHWLVICFSLSFFLSFTKNHICKVYSYKAFFFSFFRSDLFDHYCSEQNYEAHSLCLDMNKDRTVIFHCPQQTTLWIHTYAYLHTDYWSNVSIYLGTKIKRGATLITMETIGAAKRICSNRCHSGRITTFTSYL